MEAVGEHIHQLRSVSLGYDGKSYSRNVPYAAQVSRIEMLFPDFCGKWQYITVWGTKPRRRL
jgi:hypothetical protein